METNITRDSSLRLSLQNQKLMDFSPVKPQPVIILCLISLEVSATVLERVHHQATTQQAVTLPTLFGILKLTMDSGNVKMSVDKQASVNFGPIRHSQVIFPDPILTYFIASSGDPVIYSHSQRKMLFLEL